MQDESPFIVSQTLNSSFTMNREVVGYENLLPNEITSDSGSHKSKSTVDDI